MTTKDGIYAQFSCAMPRELARKGADWQHRAVYAEAVLYCRENLTDGVISRGELPFWMADLAVTKRSRMLDRLAEYGALEPHPQGWRIPAHVWAKWGRTKAEVNAIREIKSDAGTKGNHVRHHLPENGGTPSPKCPLCIAEHLARCDEGAIADASQTSRTISPEPEPEPEPEVETEVETESSSSSTSLTVVAGGRQDDDAFRRTINLIADARMRGRQGIRDPRAYRAEIIRDAISIDGEAINGLLHDGDPPDQIAAFILGHGMTAETERHTAPWCSHDCTTCGGLAWVWIEEADGFAPCPDRKVLTA